MDNEYNRAIRMYDIQIQREYRFTGNKEQCKSYWHKTIFIETGHLSLNDWRIIRTKRYWETRDSLKGIQQSIFILNEARKYMNS